MFPLVKDCHEIKCLNPTATVLSLYFFLLLLPTGSTIMKLRKDESLNLSKISADDVKTGQNLGGGSVKRKGGRQGLRVIKL